MQRPSLQQAAEHAAAADRYRLQARTAAPALRVELLRRALAHEHAFRAIRAAATAATRPRTPDGRRLRGRLERLAEHHRQHSEAYLGRKAPQ